MGLSATEIADAPSTVDTEVKAVAGRSPTQIAMERLRKDKLAVICAIVVVLLFLAGICAPLISNAMGITWDASSAEGLDATEVLESDGYPAIGPPFHGFLWGHPLGVAPQTGTDNLSTVLYGLRTSLLVSTIATIFSIVVGVSLGLLAGFSRGWLDRILSFIIDLLLSFPFILGALALTPILISRFGNDLGTFKWVSLIALITILVVFGWMGLARLIRGQVLSLREREFVQAAQVIGVPTRRILFKELLPNLVAPIVVATSLSLPGFVAAEAGLTFLGLGLAGWPSLGRMVDDAVSGGYYDLYPLYLWAPVTAIALLTLALNLLGDSVRDAFDPRTRR